MSLESEEQQILSIISNAENWTEEDFKENLKECWPIITNFIDSHKDAKIVMQVIRMAFSSFLPHVSLSLESDVLVNKFLLSIHTSCQDLIGDKKIISTDEVDEYLECVLFCMEGCKILLSFFLHFGENRGKVDFQYVERVPQRASHIINLSVKHFKERNEIYNIIVPEMEEVLQSLFKEAIEGCSLLCELISKINWTEYSEEQTSTLSEVCENLSEIAHCFSCLSEVKVSVITWKTFASIVQNHNEELKREILLVSSVDFLCEEIEEGLEMMKSFEKPLAQKMDENEEKIFDRVLKRSVFNLRILILICDKFGGFLRGTFSKFLYFFLLLFRYSYGSPLNNLPSNCKKKIDEQLMVGIFPLLSHLQNEKEFIQEVLQKFPIGKYDEINENSLKEEELRASDRASYLFFLISMIKQELINPFQESTLIGRKVDVLKNVFSNLPFCHISLCSSQKVSSFMQNYQIKDVSLYTHALICACAFVSTFNEKEFVITEKLLFENALCHCPWKSLFAADILCFISRYGSANLCENHCALLISTLKTNPYMEKDVKEKLLMLLARLLGFANAKSQRNILTDWLNGNPPGTMVAQLLFYMRTPLSEDIQVKANAIVLGSDEILSSTLGEFTEDNVKIIFEYLECVQLYFRSTITDVQKMKDESEIKNLVSFLSQLFNRFPVNYVHCSIVSRLFCQCLNVVSCLIELFDEEGVYKIYNKCRKLISKAGPDVNLCIANFVSNRSVVDYDVNKGTIRCIEEIFVSLLTQPWYIIQFHCVKALVTFAQFTKHEEVFSSVVSNLPSTISEDVTNYLQYVPKKSEDKVKYLYKQMYCICFSNEKKRESLSVEIPNDILKTVSESDNFDSEKVTKKRRLENIDDDNGIDEAEVFTHLKAVENIVKSNLKPEIKDAVKKKLEEILFYL